MAEECHISYFLQSLGCSQVVNHTLTGKGVLVREGVSEDKLRLLDTTLVHLSSILSEVNGQLVCELEMGYVGPWSVAGVQRVEFRAAALFCNSTATIHEHVFFKNQSFQLYTPILSPHIHGIQ